MYIKIRDMNGRQAVVTVSKNDEIALLKKIVANEMGIREDKQRLFYWGKQLEDGHTLHDYKINVNCLIQVTEKPDVDAEKEDTHAQVTIPSIVEEEVSCSSPYFRVGDFVDAKDTVFGAWFVGTVIGIVKCPPLEEVFYKVKFTNAPFASPTMVTLEKIRPVSRQLVDDLKPDQVVLANYNDADPKQLGYWYDFRVGLVETSLVRGTLIAGVANEAIEGVQLLAKEVYEIVPNKLNALRTDKELVLMQTPPHNRKTAPFCTKCKDNSRRKCRACGCEKCGKKDEPGKQVICDECESSYHIWCLSPPLDELPASDEWYCDDCRNDSTEVVKAGDKLKPSAKKMAQQASANTVKRDWGKGMACVGRTTECQLVPKIHFGPIPGVEVGSLWKYRVQVSEAGVHRPHVAGIHGRNDVGAFSLVLSGGYEDDIDEGEEFMYTGSGGRDLSGNKRTAEQSCDQKLTLMNRALALNCNAKINDKEGATAVDWKKGLPVRVVRNFKLRKHSKYAPDEGNRYDGIYKVVSYQPVRGHSGFVVWRYKLKRDDPMPPPWTKKGKARAASLGIEMLYPDSYLDSLQSGAKFPKTTTKRRKNSIDDQEPVTKKTKRTYKLDGATVKLISTDTANSKTWDSLREHKVSSNKEFLDKVKEAFSCLCCFELLFNPITTPCTHNVCKECLQRSFQAKIFTCPACRAELGAGFVLTTNENLSSILKELFPGYTAVG